MNGLVAFLNPDGAFITPNPELIKGGSILYGSRFVYYRFYFGYFYKDRSLHPKGFIGAFFSFSCGQEDFITVIS